MTKIHATFIEFAVFLVCLMFASWWFLLGVFAYLGWLLMAREHIWNWTDRWLTRNRNDNDDDDNLPRGPGRPAI